MYFSFLSLSFIIPLKGILSRFGPAIYIRYALLIIGKFPVEFSILIPLKYKETYKLPNIHDKKI